MVSLSTLDIATRSKIKRIGGGPDRVIDPPLGMEASAPTRLLPPAGHSFCLEYA